MRLSRNRRVVAALIAASSIAVPAAASASQDIQPPAFRTDAAQSAAAPSSDRTDAAQSAAAPSSDRTDAAQSGAGAGRVDATSAFPPAGHRGGDTPADFASAADAPAVAPTTIEVVRPERTIVRDVDEALPLILSGSALLLVLAGLALTLVHMRMTPRVRP